MSRLKTMPRAPRPRVALAALLTLAALALFFPQAGADLRAQSGRRSRVPATTPTPEPAEEGESESGAPAPKAKSTALVTFLVLEHDNPLLSLPPYVEEHVTRSFFRRLEQPAVVSVSRGGKATRREAQELAKKEREAHVVLFQLEEAAADYGRESIGQADPRTLVIKTFTYAPIKGTLIAHDRTEQRPYNPRARVGSVRIPVPVRVPERYPSELQLEQAARDAADRLLARFNVILPRD